MGKITTQHFVGNFLLSITLKLLNAIHTEFNVIELIMNNFSIKPDYALFFGKTDYVRERLVNCRSIGDICIP